MDNSKPTPEDFDLNETDSEHSRKLFNKRNKISLFIIGAWVISTLYILGHIKSWPTLESLIIIILVPTFFLFADKWVLPYYIDRISQKNSNYFKLKLYKEALALYDKKNIELSKKRTREKWEIIDQLERSHPKKSNSLKENIVPLIMLLGVPCFITGLFIKQSWLSYLGLIFYFIHLILTWIRLIKLFNQFKEDQSSIDLKEKIRDSDIEKISKYSNGILIVICMFLAQAQPICAIVFITEVSQFIFIGIIFSVISDLPLRMGYGGWYIVRRKQKK